MVKSTHRAPRRITKTQVQAVIRYIILIVVGFILIYPLLWMIGSSFKHNIDIFGNLRILPPAGRWTFEHFPNAWQLTT